jgi:alanine racemase
MRSRLTVNLAAIIANHRAVSAELAQDCRAGAVIKADGYGLGIKQVGAALAAGRDIPSFFVATLEEGIELRQAVDTPIAVLAGILPGEEREFTAHKLTPILNSPAQMQTWTKAGAPLPSILHIDTGMNRLGLTDSEAAKVLADLSLLDKARVEVVMSHFCASDTNGHPMNQIQADRFAAFKAQSGRKGSLCNSSGIYGDKSWQHDIARPGVALYGVNPTPWRDQSPVQNVVEVMVPVLQIKTAGKGETAGYDCTEELTRDSRLAVVSHGYADGLLRSGSGRVHLYWRDVKCKVMGRVSMDLLIVDVTDVPESWLNDGWMEYLGAHQTADDLAVTCKTNGYEILTALRLARSERVYINGPVTA